jgi:hypothetical protein
MSGIEASVAVLGKFKKQDVFACDIPVHKARAERASARRKSRDGIVAGPQTTREKNKKS